MAKDLYAVLGVDKNCDERELKRAYRRLARELHPDVSKDPNAEEKFKELNEAYDVLSDPNKRAQYDRFGTIPGAASGQGPFGGAGGFVDFSDIFGDGGIGDIFGDFFGGFSRGGGSTAETRREGRDMTIGLRLTLQEVATGCKKEIVYDRLATCDECEGSGMDDGAKEVTCPKCQGRGQVMSVQNTIIGQVQTTTTCPDCNGVGKKITNPCKECNGQGRVPDRQRVSVEVPAGVRDGQQLRIKGFGEAGMNNAPSGDLIVVCRIQQHEFFERDGENLLCAIEIPFTTAILGGSVEVDGIFQDEKVKIKIPKGSQHGDVIQTKASGMPRLNQNSRGSLYAQLNVKIPKKLDKKEKALVNELASLYDKKHKGESVIKKLKDVFS